MVYVPVMLVCTAAALLLVGSANEADTGPKAASRMA